MYWHKLLDEIGNREIPNKNIFTTIMEQTSNYSAQALKEQKPNLSYKLGADYQNVYFTYREAQCMLYILKGHTFNSIGNELQLSPRTIEFYVKNMKKKVGCKTKYQLIDIVLASDFLKNISDKGLV
jgi:DNA-binding CsgD family transcriptional regulator